MVLLCVIFGKRLKRAAFFKSTPAGDVNVRLKITGTGIKIARETTNNQ